MNESRLISLHHIRKCLDAIRVLLGQILTSTVDALDELEQKITTDTWKRNTIDSEGYVTKGEGNPNKVWGTDAEGNPMWKETYGIQDTPIGHIIIHMGNNAPQHYLKCDGTVYNISQYPDLAQHFKIEFGKANQFGGDGSTTFAVPDLRGEFLRGAGTNVHENSGNGADVGEHQDSTLIPETWVGDSAVGYITNSEQFWTEYGNADFLTLRNSLDISYTSPKKNMSGDNILFSPRPTNTSVLYCIKYEQTYFMVINGET